MRSLTLVGLFALLALGSTFLTDEHARSARSIKFRNRRTTGELHSWLTEEQKAEIKKAQESGENVKAKIMEFYSALPEDKKTEWNEYYKKDCVAWIKKVGSEEEIHELKALKDAGNNAVLEKKVNELKTRLDVAARKTVDEWEPECRKLWFDGKKSRKMRDISPAFKDFTTWMTVEQKAELEADKAAGKTFTDLREKTIGFLAALPIDKQKEIKDNAKAVCNAYFAEISTTEEVDKMKELHDAGKHTELKAFVDEIIAAKDAATQEIAKKYRQVCADVYGTRKKRRDISSLMDKHLSWLSEDQKKEIKDMKAAGKTNVEIKEKVMSYLHNLDTNVKKETTENMKKSCYAWLNDAATKEEVDELHKLHEVDHDACKAKVRVYIKRLPAARQEEVNRNLPFCERIWYGDHDHSKHEHHGHHHKRRHLHSSHIEKYTSWLSADQKKEVEALESAGTDFNEVTNKIKEFYQALPEEEQKKVHEEFKEKCGAWINEVGTADEVAEIKKLHDSGDKDAVQAKIGALYVKLDEHKKHEVDHVKDICKKAWGYGESRKRREQQEVTMEEAFTKWLTWLDDSQKSELVKYENDNDVLYKKIMEFYGEAQGETKEKATEQLKGACKHLIGSAIGEEHANKIKALVSEGAAFEVVNSKVMEYIELIPDEATKKEIKLTAAGCEKIYKPVAAKRMRRHEHTLEEALEKYLTWLSDEQKVVVQGLKEDREALWKKVMEFYHSASGTVKESATEQLKSGCKHYIGDAIGEANHSEIKRMVEAGAERKDIIAKVAGFISAIADPVKKEKTGKVAETCKVIFTEAHKLRRMRRHRANRHRRHQHTVQEAVEKYLTWLNDEQKAEIESLKEKPNSMWAKVLEYFQSATGDVKDKAAESLKAGCKHYIGSNIGEANNAEIQRMVEAGAAKEQIVAKIKEFVAKIEDPTLRERTAKATENCQVVFSGPARMRRENAKHLESKKEAVIEVHPRHLQWMMGGVKREFQHMVNSLITDIFSKTTGDDRKEATYELRKACKHFLKEHFGKKKAKEIKHLKDTGATFAEISEKTDEYLFGLRRELPGGSSDFIDCYKVFDWEPREVEEAFVRLPDKGPPNLKTRDEEQNYEVDPKYLKWMHPKFTHEYQTGRNQLILEAYQSIENHNLRLVATRQLKLVCRDHMMKNFGGEQKVQEIQKMKDSGASEIKLEDKKKELIDEVRTFMRDAYEVDGFIDCGTVFRMNALKFMSITWPEEEITLTEEIMDRALTENKDGTQFRITRAVVSPQTIIVGIASTNKEWMNDEQKVKLEETKRNSVKTGDIDAVVRFVVDAYKTASDQSKAAIRLQSSCRVVLARALGKEKADELVTMKIDLAPPRQLVDKANQLLAEVNDVNVKRLQPLCALGYEHSPIVLTAANIDS